VAIEKPSIRGKSFSLNEVLKIAFESSLSPINDKDKTLTSPINDKRTKLLRHLYVCLMSF
jgi:hypothetical protein